MHSEGRFQFYATGPTVRQLSSTVACSMSPSHQPTDPVPQTPASPVGSSLLTWLSAVVPGLGHLFTGRPGSGIAIGLATLILIVIGGILGRAVGLSAELFFFVTVLFPWWAFQAYDATRVGVDHGCPLRESAQEVGRRAHDIRYLGLLFIVVAAMDAYIILANPDYALSLFCSKPDGLLGVLAKIQSPTLHVVIGYGFLRLRRWALLLYLAYASFGLLNATANFTCFGYGRVRTVFLLSLLAFTGYIWLRRAHFRERAHDGRTGAGPSL